ncbi:putative Flagellar protein FlaG protein [Desulfamplus magnetovallimortis]|uniref:Putative Flagellar protein FlaG protein n=1 Tax=Desulfamplus magnetovallimortis TaxID=1246637 RepID=A0A1W1H9V3_9BACT|nr:flagellar protein FlaG [Desulfamplus magnetovallimortis]SLM29209.1 putative Flagellar protein FlaG protein [Desulfamplus magnetovallimortis]
MNINTIRSSDSMDALSPMRTTLKTQENKNDNAHLNESDQMSANKKKNLDNETLLKKEDEKKEKSTSSMEELKNMVTELNDYMDNLKTSLGFSVSKDPDNQVIFQIRNRETNEVIKQIPAEEIQTIKKKMTELTGMLLDQRA